MNNCRGEKKFSKFRAICVRNEAITHAHTIEISAYVWSSISMGNKLQAPHSWAARYSVFILPTLCLSVKYCYDVLLHNYLLTTWIAFSTGVTQAGLEWSISKDNLCCNELYLVACSSLKKKKYSIYWIKLPGTWENILNKEYLPR